LVGLYPAPAIGNPATLSSPVLVFVAAAMALGTLAHDLWYVRSTTPAAPSLAQANVADGSMARRPKSRHD